MVAHTAEEQWNVTLQDLKDDEVWPKSRTIRAPSPHRFTRDEAMYIAGKSEPKPNSRTVRHDLDTSYTRIKPKSQEDLLSEANTREANAVSIPLHSLFIKCSNCSN